MVGMHPNNMFKAFTLGCETKKCPKEPRRRWLWKVPKKLCKEDHRQGLYVSYEKCGKMLCKKIGPPALLISGEKKMAKDMFPCCKSIGGKFARIRTISDINDLASQTNSSSLLLGGKGKDGNMFYMCLGINAGKFAVLDCNEKHLFACQLETIPVQPTGKSKVYV